MNDFTPIEESPAQAPSAYLDWMRACQDKACKLGLDWNFPVDDDGVSEAPWEVSSILGLRNNAPLRLIQFGLPEDYQARADSLRSENAKERIVWKPTSEWLDFMKAIAIERITNRKSESELRADLFAARLLSAITDSLPWNLTPEDLVRGLQLATRGVKRERRVIEMEAMIRWTLDMPHRAHHIMLTASPSVRAILSHDNVQGQTRRVARQSLNSRLRAEQLPEKRAFWELVRIVFTDIPKSFNDALRFAIIRLLIITGMRVTEAVMLPLDWKRVRESKDFDGASAASRGGTGDVLTLRYFPAKQGAANRGVEGYQFLEDFQPVPPMFEAVLQETLEEIEKLTAPMRSMVRNQRLADRLFPMYGRDELVSAVELMIRITGNPTFAGYLSSEARAEMIEECSKSRFDITTLRTLLDKHLVTSRSSPEVRKHLSGLTKLAFQFSNRDRSGNLMSKVTAKNVSDVHWRIGEIEDALMASRFKPTWNFSRELASGGRVTLDQLLFLQPSGSLTTLFAPDKLVGISPCDETFIMNGLCRMPTTSLFIRYGKTEEDKSLSLESHDFRHLLDNEMFRHNVSDAIITKRFARTSVAQSHAYDHRSLEESLDGMDLTDREAELLGDSHAAKVLLLHRQGRLGRSDVMDAFLRIQEEEGEDAALQFLATEADGFHTTPYGHCLTSFAINPCEKQLQCFNNCKHLVTTDRPEHRVSLVKLEGSLKTQMEALQKRDLKTPGSVNQLKSCKDLLEGVAAALAASPGAPVFPEGVDRSKPKVRRVI